MYKVEFEKEYYFPGSVVKGSVILTITEPKDFKSLTISIGGAAHVHWSEGSGDSRRSYYNSITYIKEKREVWSKETSSGDLHPGEHVYPFEFTLPENIPPSFKSHIGNISYGIKAKLSLSGMLKRFFKYNAAFTVKDNREKLSSCTESVTVEKASRVQYLCFNFGSVNVTCDLPRTGYHLGDEIPISVYIDNQTTKTARVKVTLCRTDIFTSSSGRTRVLNSHMSLTSSPPLLAGATQSFSGKELTVPLETPPSLDNCTCIRVEYSFCMSVVAYMGVGTAVKVPLVIAETLN